MYKETGSRVMMVVIMLVSVLAITILVSNPLSQSEPIVSLTSSLNRDRFKTSENAILTLHLENHNESGVHIVRFRFVTDPLVKMCIGNSELTKETTESGNYTYCIILQPLQKTDQPFVVVVPRLPIGRPELKFSITIEAYIYNQLKHNQEVIFTVEK